MIARIVMMEICPEKMEYFKKTLRENVKKIRSFKGCLHLEVFRDCHEPCRIFTISIWECERDLENYRQSEFFQDVWPRLKKCFCGKPQARTMEMIEELQP
ncbi:MAG: antibiotic biosynthesis monooxygenase [Bacteroidia bacterium]|nr:antibiotic biosynthesis monooxygenase [Bacteroidia bacterium]